MQAARAIALLFTLLLCALAQGKELGSDAAGTVLRIATREGVSVPVYAYWQDSAVATVILYSGGGGGYGRIGEDGWPAGGNFLIRTGKNWASYPFNVIMVGRPTDGIDLSFGGTRAGDLHGADNVALLRAIKKKSDRPIWLVGTSMGTISAAAATIRDTDKLVAGLVLTSSILAYKIAGAVPRLDLAAIRVPTLVVHHADDACWACPPRELDNLTGALKSTSVKKTVLVQGGSGSTGDPCEPMHHHGFIGRQEEVVDQIANWIISPSE